MANIKSAKKRAKTNEKRRQINVTRRTDLRSATKKVVDALEANNLDEAKSLLRNVESKIARASSKGVVKKNTASRKISRLAKKVARALKEQTA